MFFGDNIFKTRIDIIRVLSYNKYAREVSSNAIKAKRNGKFNPCRWMDI